MITLKMLKHEWIFLEQLEYPDQSRSEQFVVGWRVARRSLWRGWDTFLYQVNLTAGSVKTYWGMKRWKLVGLPDMEEAQRLVVGGLITDYPLEARKFQVVKEIPQWPLVPEQTLAMELCDTPAVFEVGMRIEARHYPLVTSAAVGGGLEVRQREGSETMLSIIRDVIRYARGNVNPISVQVLFKPTWTGSTRYMKRKRRAGERWVEDTYRAFRTQLERVERARGKAVGYWVVTTRILAPKNLAELVSGLNRAFPIRQVKAKKAIQRFGHKSFGKKLRMSSMALKRIVKVPTGDIFSRELLGAATASRGRGARGPFRIHAFPREGYILGRDDDRQDICLNDAMLRAHLLIVGRTGCWKTSLMRFFALELARNPQNRLFILDYAGEYTQLLEHLGGVVVLRPGSEEFPLGINFLDWAQTLGMDVDDAESWILKVLETLIRGCWNVEFTAKMESMLREMIRRELKQGGTLIDLFQDLWVLRTRIRKTKRELGKRKAQGKVLSEEEELALADYGTHDLTIEAIQNRLRDLYGSPLRQVFFVQRTTMRVEELLDRHVILDLSELRRQGIRNDLLRLFCEFILLYLSRGVALRQKGWIRRRNVVVIEEAQQLVPEVLAKRTLVDGTMPEELIGTLGGYGLTLMFISAQPGLLSRAIIAGCHTKVVFSLQGHEAALFANTLEVEPDEVSRLQVGECLIRAAGTGVCKVAVRTWQAYPEPALARLEGGYREFPPEIMKQSRAAYEFLGEQPLEYYSTLVEVIEEVNGEGKNFEEEAAGMVEEMLGCWAQKECGLCKINRRMLRAGVQMAKQYWQQTKKVDLGAFLKLYPMDPLILYEKLRTFAYKKGVEDAELVAFCAHWGLMERCRTNSTLGKTCTELWEQGREALVTQFVAIPEIQELLTVGKTVFKPGSKTHPAFSLRDSFCAACPLDKALREDFCMKYRQKAVQQLIDDPELEQQLEELVQIDFQKFFEACFEAVSKKNSGASYCLATAFLKRKWLSERQRAILLEKAQKILESLASRRPPLGEPVEDEKETLPEHKESENDTTSSWVIPTPERRQTIETIETLFVQHGGIVSRREFKQQLQSMGLWTLKTFYSILHEHIGVKKFRVAIQKRGEDQRRVKAETYYVSPEYYSVDTPLALYRVMHNFIMEQVKNFLSVTCAVKDIARLDQKTGKPIITDLEVRFGSRKVYVEYTKGRRDALYQVLRKIKGSSHHIVLLVGLDQPPRRSKHDPVGVQSNKLEALEIAEEIGAEVQVFTLTNLSELETFCKTGKRVYTQ